MNAPVTSMVHGVQAQLKALPSVDKLMKLPPCVALVEQCGLSEVTEHARSALAQARSALLQGSADPECNYNTDWVLSHMQRSLTALFAPRMRSVINLTGTVIHTNLGRSVLSPVVMEHVVAMMQGPNNLEYDLAEGGRGDRDDLIEELVCHLTGAEAATVVNNNAAAVLLTIAALAGGKESIVSRGELVEIGGAFRMPDVMTSAGSKLVEVGTTNRTHLKDYEQAINPNTGLIMKVHTSNYVVQGFTRSVSEAELAPLAKAKGVPLATDLGSGALVDLSRWGLPKEPLPQEALADGCDVVTFSGDKLLGGPQAGLIVGRKDLVGKIRKFPMKRALRLSKLPFAALEATLRLYLNLDQATTHLPTLRWLTRPVSHIQQVALALLPVVQQAVQPQFVARAVPLKSQIGSGSLPVEVIPSYGLALAPAGVKRKGAALDALCTTLRGLSTPIIARVHNDECILDCRCVDDVHQIASLMTELQGRLA